MPFYFTALIQLQTYKTINSTIIGECDAKWVERQRYTSSLSVTIDTLEKKIWKTDFSFGSTEGENGWRFGAHGIVYVIRYRKT